MFISTNTAVGGGKLIRDFARLVVERYFPPGPLERYPPSPPANFSERASRFVGNYVVTRRSHTTVEKLLNPVASVITATKDGHLLLTSPLGENRFVEVAPLTFQEVETGDRIRFSADERGKITGIHLALPVFALEKVGWTGAPISRYAVMGFAIFVFQSAGVGAWLRRKRAVTQSASERAAVITILVTAALWTAGLVLATASLVPYLKDFRGVFYDFPPAGFDAGLTLLIVAAVGTLASLVLLVPVWRQRSWTHWRRVRHTGVVLTAALLLMVLWDGNAIGYRYF